MMAVVEEKPVRDVVAVVSDKKKAGRVAVVGRPNAGKSTLLNQLLHMKVSITSPRPQTTRKLLEVVYEDEQGQIVFIDTPGLFVGKGKTANYFITEALGQVDAVLYLVDVTRSWGQEEASLWDRVQAVAKPVVVGLNKIDSEGQNYLGEYKHIFKKVESVVEISAVKGTNTPRLIKELYAVLPWGQRETGADDKPVPILNMNSREYLAEIVREKVFTHLHQELPYVVEVEVEKLETDKKKLTLWASLKVPAKKQGLVIGRRGQKLREIMLAVRKELVVATGKQVVVRLSVES